MRVILTIDLHGKSLDEAKVSLVKFMDNARKYDERVIRIVHGIGKHSDVFPVIKSFVRHWLEDSEIRDYIDTVFRGEDGSPYTKPNAGETIVVLKGTQIIEEDVIDWEEEEKQESIRHAKKLRAGQRGKKRKPGKFR